jgi:hypothetical protein
MSTTTATPTTTTRLTLMAFGPDSFLILKNAVIDSLENEVKEGDVVLQIL